MSRTSSILSEVFLGLAIIGAINWGAVALFDYNLVAALFETSAQQITFSLASRIVYALVGLGGLGLLAMLPETRRQWHGNTKRP